jgi:hypothetical protein
VTALSVFFHLLNILKSSPEGEGFNHPRLQTLKMVQGKLIISYAGQEIASHTLLPGKKGQVTCAAHYAGLMSAKGQQRPPAKRPQHDPAWKEEGGLYEVLCRSLSVYEQFAKAFAFVTGVSW